MVFKSPNFNWESYTNYGNKLPKCSLQTKTSQKRHPFFFNEKMFFLIDSFADWPLFLRFFHFWSFQIFGGLTSLRVFGVSSVQFHPCFFVKASILHHNPEKKTGKRLGGTTKSYCNRSTFETKTLTTMLVGGWTTHLKKKSLSNWIISPGSDKNKKYFFNPPPSMSLLRKPSPLLGCPNHLAQLALVASLPDIATSMCRRSSAGE